MQQAIVVELVIILALVLLNGVLSGAEIAVVSLRRTRLRELVSSGRSTARVVQGLRQQPERFLATVQIGITVVGATAGAFGGHSFSVRLEPYLARVPFLEPYAETLALIIVVTLISYLSLVLGELVPKSLALRSAETYALLVARPLAFLARAARPLVWLLTASSNAVLKLFGDRTSFMEARLSPEELQQMVGEAAKGGTLHPQAGQIAQRAIEFADLVVADVMVPRHQVVSLPRSASREELRRILLEQSHSRLPVHEGDVDRVVGYVSIKDILALAWEEQLFVLEDALRPAWFVPETMRAVDLLREMQRRRLPFTVVVDERGGMAGIVTLEDLVEELVGEIFHEHDHEIPQPFTREEDGSVVAQGTVAVRDLNRELGWELPEEGDWSTVAGLCLALASRIPAVGERYTTENGYALEVVEASARRVKRVRVRAPAPAAA